MAFTDPRLGGSGLAPGRDCGYVGIRAFSLFIWPCISYYPPKGTSGSYEENCGAICMSEMEGRFKCMALGSLKKDLSGLRHLSARVN